MIIPQLLTGKIFSHFQPFPSLCSTNPPAFVLVSLPKREALEVTKRILLTNISVGSGSGAWSYQQRLDFQCFHFCSCLCATTINKGPTTSADTELKSTGVVRMIGASDCLKETGLILTGVELWGWWW